MRGLILAVFLVGCFPPPPHDCETEGGMYVTGVACDAELNAFQRRIEAEGPSLRWVSLNVRTKDLNEKGGFDANGISVGGLTYCTGPLMIIAKPEWVQGWGQTALAHEAFHVMQGCPWDDQVYKECFTRYDASSAQAQAQCTFEAQHPHWDTTVFSALIRINNEAAIH